jgi:hypothetical protein
VAKKKKNSQNGTFMVRNVQTDIHSIVVTHIPVTEKGKGRNKDLVEGANKF